MEKSEIINLLKKYNLRPKKSFGQNFLKDEFVLQKIVQAAEIEESDCIVEVGPGLGILTKKLAVQAKKVITIELDKSLESLLKNELFKFSNIELKNMDALKFDPPKENYKVVANIPYNITSPLISHFLESERRPDKIVLLIQKEVAEKICAKAGKLNVIAIHVQIFGTPKIISKVPAESFFPAPKVDSAVIYIDMYKNPLVKKENLKNFFKIVHAGFSHRRKTIINALERKLDTDRSTIKSALKKCNISENARAQHLKIDDWSCLSQSL